MLAGNETALMERGSGPNRARSFQRLPLSGQLEYIDSGSQWETAQWVNVGRGGACLRLNGRRGLSPFILLRGQSQNETPWELKVRVAWVDHDPATGDHVAGVRILLDSSEASTAISHLLYDAYAAAGQVHSDEHSVGAHDGSYLSVDPEWANPNQIGNGTSALFSAAIASALGIAMANAFMFV